MPYLYTTFKISTGTGWPIIRPAWYEFPADEMTFTLSEQFMWGDQFMIIPKISEPS
jgi:alpha-glucosidase